MPSPDPVADLVGRLERAVVASGRRRREVAREIEGDLREAVAARVEAGAPEPLAASAVVAEFGDPRAIAAELSTELLADRGRRFAPRAALAAATLLVVWFVGMTALAAVPGFRVPIEDGWMLQVSRALDAAGPIVAGAAAAGWLAIRRSGSLAALVAVAGLQLAFAVALVAGAVAMAATIAVPAAGAGILAALLVTTLVLGSSLAVAAAALLVRWGAVRLAPRRARS
ncbi:permease prefix domain 1-containing protein [Agrococcus sediminis]|uniref:permease prefix domain 1-containing protein n=1 Tax=Agrococcus sediminis TaxID=2599924 RepID=UPI00342C68A5